MSQSTGNYLLNKSKVRLGESELGGKTRTSTHESSQIFELPTCGRRGGLMVSALDLGASGPGSSPGRGHCVVFLGKTLYSHGASLHPGV